MGGQGACEGYPAWMKANCPSACNFCNGLCEDTSPSADCAGYAEQHGCAQRTSSTLQGHTTLQQKCRKTCNFCPSNGFLIATNTLSLRGNVVKHVAYVLAKSI